MTNAELITALSGQPGGQEIRYQDSYNSPTSKVEGVDSYTNESGTFTRLQGWVVRSAGEGAVTRPREDN